MNTNLSYVSLLLLLLAVAGALAAEKCHPSDKKTLFKIKEALHNPYHLASWHNDTDCCDWYCVDCDPKTNRINALTIFSGTISGQIPAAVGDLDALETLVFRKLTNLTGTIQPTIANLKNLKMLRLSWTNLTGPVPGFIGKLKNLFFLELSFNQLTGSIPPELSQLPNLGALHLDRNMLTGSIPESFGSFPGADPPWLYLSHNQLTGDIPKSLGNLDFNVLDFSRNKLTGDASFLFGANKTAMWVFLDRNELEFDVSGVVFPATLTQLELSHNRVYGRLPESLVGLGDLGTFNVSYNRLCGKIPVGGRLQSFDEYSYFHNKCLCGAPLGVSCK